MRRGLILAVCSAVLALSPLPCRAAVLGLIPAIFPEDPVDFDTYREQMAIGQILEPLVTSDRFGNVAAAVAEKWEILEKGRLLRFRLRPGAVFSTGAPLTAADAAASLLRHWKNNRSQSYSLLQNVVSIKAPSPAVVEIRLKRPQVAIFKILSREHLGVQPKDWRFSKKSPEPYIGSGPYRLLKRGADWVYVPNERYHDRPAVPPGEWTLEFVPFGNSTPAYLEKLEVLPDYAPALLKVEMEALKRNPRFDLAARQFHPQFSFSQLSAWWNPRSSSYGDLAARRIKMGAIRMLFKRREAALHAQPAFGLIPYGISGHQTARLSFEDVTRDFVEGQAKRDPRVKVVRVAGPGRLHDEVFAAADVAAVEKLLGVKFELGGRDPKREALPDAVDVIVDRWAGGFSDPEGFVPIMMEISQMPIEEYLSSLKTVYLAASSELDWTKRSELFKKLDHDLAEQERMVPGWKTEFYTLLSNDLAEAESSFRYTPKLLDIRRK